MMSGPEPKRPDPNKIPQSGRQAGKADKRGEKTKKSQAAPGKSEDLLRETNLPGREPDTVTAETEKADQQWQHFTTELRMYRDQQLKDWQGVDDLLLARYLLNNCSEEERARVETALQDSDGKVAKCLKMLEQIVGDQDQLSPEPAE